MQAKILLAFLFSILTVFATTHILALHFTLYFRYPSLDIPMHILGGAIVAFIVLLMPYSSLRVPARYTELTPVLATTLIVALLWEIFEIRINVPLFEAGFVRDMFGDISMGLVGSVLGYFVGHKMKSF